MLHRRSTLPRVGSSSRTSLGQGFRNLQDGDIFGALEAVRAKIDHLDKEAAVNLAMLGSPSSSQHSELAGSRSRSRNRTESADGIGILLTQNDIESALHGPGRGEQAAGSSSTYILESNSADPGPKQRGPMFRRRKAKPKRVDSQAPGLFGAHGNSHLTKAMGNYFATVGSTHEKRIVALSAWGASVLGLMIALIFVTRDFLQSREDTTTAVNQVMSDHVELPRMYVCNREAPSPFFLHLPNSTYPGVPLLQIESTIFPGNGSRLVKYPETHTHPQFEERTMDGYGRACESGMQTRMSAMAFEKYMERGPECFCCLVIKDDPSLVVQRRSLQEEKAPRKSDLISTDSFSMRASVILALRECSTAYRGLRYRTLQALVQLLAPHAKKLEEQNILDFGGMDPTLEVLSTVLFPSSRALSPTQTFQDNWVPDVIDCLCNTVLFSGYFYPTESPDVKFRFDPARRRWSRAGAGPFLPSKFSDWYTTEPRAGERNLVASPVADFNLAVDSPLVVTPALGGKDILRLYLDPIRPGARLRDVTTLGRGEQHNVFLMRQNIFGDVSYLASSVDRLSVLVDSRTDTSVSAFSVAPQDFFTRIVSDQVTVSWSAFICDFFGLISLFLDLSVFTLIVSPIVVSTRRRAVLARSRAARATSD